MTAVMPLLSGVILSMFAGMGDDLLDAAQMYDEDTCTSLLPRAAASLRPTGLPFPAPAFPGKPPRNWPGGCWICSRG